ncbi:cysteine dioxygenase family protein [Sporichthya brevicatena]|uniref:Cysteine dioxygenase family protein n=1 Tax=Sporichthya brevicatena TaxID=171442 RepID=A0ABP3SB14_9ACTN
MSTQTLSEPRAGRSTITTAGSPARIALALAAQPALWRPAVRFDPAARVHTRIAAEADWEAWLLTWLPGQGTDIHDHGGSAGALLPLRGVLSEWTPGGTGRLGRAFRPGRTRRLRGGDLRAFGSDHVHRVRNDADAPAVSLHVYAPRLESMTRYALVEGRLVPLSTERAGADW